MLEIEIEPIVLETLKQHFPKKNSAKRAIDKYIRLLTEQLTQSVMHGRSAWMAANGLYTISVSKQRNRGSQIGRDKIRLQNWLEDNNLNLFDVSVIGSNFTKKLSVIKLTNLAHIKSTVTVFKTKQEIETEELQNLLNDQAITNENFFNSLYPELSTLSEIEVKELFDIVPIDMKSLSNYIHWIQHDSDLIDTRKKLQIITQADAILRIAQFTDGVYFQRKKASEFGRHYYSGTSVQNVNKDLRRAMLGHCWEYDIRSSVFTWKMGHAQDCYLKMITTETFEQVFSQTLLYLEDKKDFMATLRHYTYTSDTTIPRELQDKDLKRAITAISFGARRGTTGWRISDDETKNPALVEIFKNMQTRERFMNCPTIKKFISEQNVLDKYISQTCREVNPPFMQLAEVRTASGRMSKSKIIAYLYQHFETQIMDLVAEEIEQRGRKVLARIHDAIIINKRLGIDSKEEIEEAMRQWDGNKYWHLTAKELQPFDRPYSMDRAEIESHRERIRQEEANAKEKKSKGFLRSIYDWVS